MGGIRKKVKCVVTNKARKVICMEPLTLDNSKYSILDESEDDPTEKRTNHANQLLKSKDCKGTKLLKEICDFD